MRKICAATIAAASLSLPLHAEFKALWPLDGRLALVDSQVPGRSAEDNLKSAGADLELHFNPVLGWTQSRWLLLPSLDVDSSSANTILKVDDQRFEFLAQSTTRVELGTAFKRTPDQRFGARLFSEGFQAKQAVNETLATGQYNYQDGGLAIDWRQKWETETPFRSTLGLTSTHRQYPNWQSLDASQRREKDQDITRLYTDLEWAWNGMKASTDVGLSLQGSNYTEAVIVDEDGTTATATKRKDAVLELTLSNPFQVGRHSWSPSLGVSSWGSNFSDYDSQNNFYFPHYSDYIEGDVGLGYAYDFEGPWAWGFFNNPQLTADLGLSLRQYTGRLAHASDGSLTDQAERDFSRNLSLGFNSAYTEHWAFYARLTFMNAASNNEDQSSALYNYTFNTLSLGANFFY